MGADHILNYRENPNWGEVAKSLSPKGAGVNHILEVGGPVTMEQSLEAIAPEGVISIIGYLGGTGKDQAASFMDCLERDCTVRGILVGSRMLFEQLVEAVDATGIKPLLDEKEWTIENAKAAFEYMVAGKHFVSVTLLLYSSVGK